MDRKEGFQALFKRPSIWLGLIGVTACAFAAWTAPAVLS